MTGTEIMSEDDVGGGAGLDPVRPLKSGGAAPAVDDVIHEDQIEIVDDGLADGRAPKEDDEDGERRLRTDDIREERDAEQEDIKAGLTPDERKARAEARRQRRKLSKQRRRQRESSSDLRIKSLERTVADLTGRLVSVAERSDGQDLVQVRTAIDETKRYLQQAEGVIKDAFTKQDAEAHTAGLKAYTQAEKRLESLQRIEKNLVENPPSAALKVAGGTAMQALMKDWMTDHSWFDPKGSDEDSGIALTVDAHVKAAGFDPNTPEYWEELDKRLRRRLPHRYEDDMSDEDDSPARRWARPEEDDDADPGSRGGPPVGGGGKDRRVATNGVKKQYTISKARVEELKRTGVWDDPEQRTKYLKAYQKWDKVNPQARQAQR